MRNFITIRNEKERKIFINYCKKHNIKLISGTEIFINMELFQYLRKLDFKSFLVNILIISLIVQELHLLNIVMVIMK